MSYIVGQSVRLKAEIFNAAGALVAPTAITLRIKPPTGDVVVVTPIAQAGAVGVYTHDLVLSASGEWLYRFETTGTVTVTEGAITVAPSRVLTN